MTMILTSDASMVDQFLAQLVDDGRSPRTIRTYSNTLSIYLRWLGERTLSVVDVTPSDVREFAKRDRMKAPGGASAATRRRDITTVRLFHQWANEEGFGVPTMRSVRTPKVPNNGPRPIHDDVWRRLWGSDLDEHDRLWLGLGYFGGLRRIEIVTCPPAAVDRPQVGMMQFVRKGGSEHPIELHLMVRSVAEELPWLCDGWEQWYELLRRTAAKRLGLGANHLWYDAMDDPVNDGNRLNKRMAKLTGKLGLDGAVTPHRLRHSCATNLLRAGWPADEVKVALSHSSIDITQRYADYAGVTARRLQREGK